MIRTGYLAQKEKADTIPLWQEAFPEDSAEFLEYYYREKAKDNRILAVWENEQGPDQGKHPVRAQEVLQGRNPAAEQKMGQCQEQPSTGTWEPAQEQPSAEIQDGPRRIISMIHRNPYRLWVNGRTIDSDYIVAVATAKDRRHQGLMRMLINQMLKDMHREKMPFCYLMPADRRIYEPFGFVYIYDQEHWGLKKEIEEGMKTQKVRREDAGRAAGWMARWLEERYQVFAVRDRAYVERLLEELESESGWMEFLFENEDLPGKKSGSPWQEPVGNPIGIRCWWGTREREQRMLLCREEDRELQKEKTPAIMARITNLEACLELVHLKKDSPAEELEVILQVKDEACPWNAGGFLWKIGRDKSSAVRQEEDALGKGSHIPISVEALTQKIFGYTEGEEPEGVWRYVDTLKGVFLDEVV